MASSEPYEEEFPVDFRSGGDTTKDAFGKHIQEIKRIYGILTALNNGKVSADDVATSLTNHINDTNPHPNWKLSLSDLTGDIDASKVKGKLENANIDTSGVNGLKDFIDGRIPDNKGISAQSLGGNGYIKFANGFLMQWGVQQVDNNGNVEQMQVARTIEYPIAFTANVWGVFMSGDFQDADHNTDCLPQHIIHDLTWFKYRLQVFSNLGNWQHTWIHWLAIGK